MKHREVISVIALHGVALSDEEIDWAAHLVTGHIDSPEIRWRFPRASRRPLTILRGQPARAWYDIRTFDRSRMDEAGIEGAAARVQEMVRSERDGSPKVRKVVLMGFSQGGALALHAGLGPGGEVDGIIALATALPFPDRIPQASHRSPPLFLGHGFLDTHVPYALGRETGRALSSKGYETEWHSYAQGHTTGSRQLYDVGRWLDRHFLNPRPTPGLPALHPWVWPGQSVRSGTFVSAEHSAQQ